MQKVMLPPNGASMYDTSRTREDEKPGICDTCERDPFSCGWDSMFCEQCAMEAAIDLAIKAKKEDAL